jgi:hypothetical protein
MLHRVSDFRNIYKIKCNLKKWMRGVVWLQLDEDTGALMNTVTDLMGLLE